MISRRTSFFWAGTFWLFVLPMQIVAATANVRHVISGAVLCKLGADGHIQRIPLPVTELTRTGAGVHLRWPEGNRARSMAINFPYAFADALEREALSARSAQPGIMLGSTIAAAQAVTFGFPAPRHLGALLMLGVPYMGLSLLPMFWNQPLFLLALATLPFLPDHVAPRYLLMLSGDHLWVLRDAAHPELRLSRQHSLDLIMQLKRRLR